MASPPNESRSSQPAPDVEAGNRWPGDTPPPARRDQGHPA